MGTRTNDLTEFAKPVADELAARCGSLKRVLSAVKIEPKSILASFTHWVLQFRIVKTGLNGIHKLYTIKILLFFKDLFGKSGIKNADDYRCGESDGYYRFCGITAKSG